MKWNYLTVYKNMNSGLFKNIIYKLCLEIIFLVYE